MTTRLDVALLVVLLAVAIIALASEAHGLIVSVTHHLTDPLAAVTASGPLQP